MNYRHAFHAGNFADVVKHVVVTRLVEYLKRKDKAFRVVDTHAGAGLYDLTASEAQRSGEWRAGIGRLMDAGVASKAGELMRPYLDAVAASNPRGGIKRYPGSPALIRHLLRKQDRLTAIELHREDARRLSGLFEGDFQVRTIELDGWLSLGAHLPPKEKRGLVLVDPPYEEPGEFQRLLDGLLTAHRRWPGGIYALWYPIKDREAMAGLRGGLRRSRIARILDIRFDMRTPSSPPRLDGGGLIVVNPPFTLEDELRIILPALQSALAEPGGGWTVEWLAGDAPALDP